MVQTRNLDATRLSNPKGQTAQGKKEGAAYSSVAVSFTEGETWVWIPVYCGIPGSGAALPKTRRRFFPAGLWDKFTPWGNRDVVIKRPTQHSSNNCKASWSTKKSP